ncbi:ABC transporter permease [Acidobacteria bacterium AB60]|nr:ABC transporter permease [Acidobacteria bacterium AB60]
MSARSRFSTWWRALTRGREMDAHVDEELRFHIESYADDLMQSGVPREEAMRRARAEIGSIAARKEEIRAAWGARLLDQLSGDLRYGARMLARSPGFAAIAIGSLALGIGVNTVIFTAAQHMLFDRLVVPHADQLRLLWWTQPDDGAIEDLWGEHDPDPSGGHRSTSFSYPVYEQLRDTNRAMEELFAFKRLGRQTFSLEGQSEAVQVEMVSGNYFRGLGVRTQAGRGIEDSDDAAPGSGPVAVISDNFWRSRFASAPNVVGRTIRVNTIPLTIVGVAPAGFTGAYSAQSVPDIFLPFSMQPVVAPEAERPSGGPSLLTNTDLWWVMVMGRVRPGTSDQSAEAALNAALNAAVRTTMPANAAKPAPRLLLLDGSRGQNPSASLTQPMYVLMGLAGFVLLLACANLANLLLARAGARAREASVRVALGASRGRVLCQMMTESLMLSMLGGGAGVLLAYTVRNAVPHLLSSSWTPPAFSARFDWRVLTFSVAISIATGVVFGLAPAWESARIEVGTGMKDASRTFSPRRRGLAGKSLVVVQVALSMLLVVGAGLFVQTLSRLSHERLGFNPDHLILFGVEPPQTRYPGVAANPLYARIEARLAAVPGVRAVTLTDIPLISGSVSMHTFIPEGEQRKRQGNRSALSNYTGRTFFSTYGIPIVAGRGFDDTDTEASGKVAVINESLARKFFPHQNPIAKTFETGPSDHPLKPLIVGVCGDAKYDSVRKPPEPTYYLPYWEAQKGVAGVTFAVSTRMETAAIEPSLRKIVAEIDGSVPVLDVRTQNEQIGAKMQHERIFADLTASFGILALVLASIGMYGLMAYAVSRRTNEIGIRMALGAQPGLVLRMILGEASWLTGIGVAAGAGAALGMGRLIGSMLYGLKPWDPYTFFIAAALLSVVAMGASCAPAWRAAHISPMRALRHE